MSMRILLIFYTVFSCSLFPMNFEEKIGKLFVVPVCPTFGEKHLQEVRTLLQEKHIGGVIFMGGDTKTQKKWVELLQRGRETPLLTFQDAEWGIGMRLKDVPALPKNLTLGAIQNLELLQRFGKELARQCRTYGIRGNLAPVVDVNSNPKNPVIHMRSFGDNPHEVSKRALAVMEGMRKGGILTCAKHFPGHGDVAVDSHRDLPRIDKSLEEIAALELIPFKALIDQGVDMVMIGHLLFPEISSAPSSLSKEIVTKLLREDLGFDGVIITDGLNMRALADRYGVEEIILKAFLAGADLLLTATADVSISNALYTKEIPRAIALLKKKCLNGEIAEEEIDKRLQRIDKLRKPSFAKMPLADPALKKELFYQALTQIGEIIPFEKGAEIALVQNRPDPELEALLKKEARVHIYTFEEMKEASSYSHILINIRDKMLPSWIPNHAIITLFATPYLLDHLPKMTNVLIGYENTLEAKEAVIDTLFGRFTPFGKLPIQLFGPTSMSLSSHIRPF